jgi:hypothetical protein
MEATGELITSVIARTFQTALPLRGESRSVQPASAPSQSWFPPLPFHGQQDAVSDVLTVTDTPLELYFSCSLGHSSRLLHWVHPVAYWLHPTINVETYTPPSFPGKLIGPALPNKPRVGPGPIQKVFGSG